MIKKFYTLAIIFLCLILNNCEKNKNIIEWSNLNKNGTWTKVESGVTNWLYDVEFTDNQNGWIVGDSGIILHSVDAGELWEHQLSPKEDLLCAVDFTDVKNGWICGMNSILKTTDGGVNWEIRYIEDLGDGRFRDIKFLNKNIGFVVGGRGSFGTTGVLYKTVDGGETWQIVSLNGLPTLTNISIVDEKNIWICGFGGTILSTEDEGLTWTKRNLNISPSPSLTTIQFVDQSNGWVSSRDDWLGFFRTTDGGNNWTQRTEESLSIFGIQTFFFIGAFDGWVGLFPAGEIYTIARTVDGGQSWKYQNDFGVSQIYSFCFINGNLGWAVGWDAINQQGLILLYKSIK